MGTREPGALSPCRKLSNLDSWGGGGTALHQLCCLKEDNLYYTTSNAPLFVYFVLAFARFLTHQGQGLALLLLPGPATLTRSSPCAHGSPGPASPTPSGRPPGPALSLLHLPCPSPFSPSRPERLTSLFNWPHQRPCVPTIILPEPGSLTSCPDHTQTPRGHQSPLGLLCPCSLRLLREPWDPPALTLPSGCSPWLCPLVLGSQTLRLQPSLSWVQIL